jgi:hypothetical protein
MLTLLLWRSGWFGPRWLVAMIALAWAALDEVSQGIPILQRTVTWYDLLANVCGVTCAMAVLWAMGPLQSAEQLAGPDRARARLFQYTFDDMFARRKPWLIGLACGLLCCMMILLARPLLPSPRAVGIFGLLVVIVASHALYLVYRRIFFHDLRRVQRERPCLTCGARANAARLMRREECACSACGEDRFAGAYEMAPRPSLAAVLRISLFPALVAFAGVVALFALVLLLPIVYGWSIATPAGSRYVPRLAQLVGRVPPELSSAVDLTVYMLLISLVVRLWRRRFAAHVDQSVRCRTCGHDLHGTPTNERGEGHCGECGAAFVREVNADTTEHAGKGIETAEQRERTPIG